MASSIPSKIISMSARRIRSSPDSSGHGASAGSVGLLADGRQHRAIDDAEIWRGSCLGVWADAPIRSPHPDKTQSMVNGSVPRVSGSDLREFPDSRHAALSYSRGVRV